MSAENAPSAAPLLDVQSVNVYYGEFHALQDVSYRIHEGEIVSLLGGNASGKSTTMKTILRLVKPRSGEIRFDGRSILGMSPRAMAAARAPRHWEGAKALRSLLPIVPRAPLRGPRFRNGS